LGVTRKGLPKGWISEASTVGASRKLAKMLAGTDTSGM